MAGEETGSDRRIQDAAALATMAVQIANLINAVVRVEAGQNQLLQRLEASEHRSTENCRTCTTWERLQVIEQFKAAAEERLKAVGDHETRLRWVEPRVYAAIVLASILTFIVGKVWR